MPLTSTAVAKLLTEWYDRLKRTDKNRFRLMYYQAAASKVRVLGDEFTTMTARQLAQTTGLSEDFSRKVITLRDRGTHTELEDLRGRTAIPARCPREAVIQTVESVVKKFRGQFPSGKIEPCGSYRRGAPDLHDLDFLISGVTIKEYQDFARSLGPNYGEIEVRVNLPCSEGNSLPTDFRYVPEESWGAGLLWFTGSAQFNVECRTAAKNRGWTLNQDGLFDANGTVLSRDEKEILEKIGIPWRPPEQR
jgi:DNA polymerase/3'-5' exonuclease PolX